MKNKTRVNQFALMGAAASLGIAISIGKRIHDDGRLLVVDWSALVLVLALILAAILLGNWLAKRGETGE
jgi:hypothetical protein